MESYADVLLQDLIDLISDLGKDGGLISPSVYDTAQVLRLYPPKEGVEPGLEWLLSQQQSDGGWGTPSVPLHRDMPTLAAVLALKTYSHQVRSDDAVAAGLDFLQRQSSQWVAPLPADIPVAAELILPRLVQDARSLGLDIPPLPYAELIKLGQRKLNIIEKLPVAPGTQYAYSWEAWGSDPAPELLDVYGSVSSSPSATAAWLKRSARRGGLEVERERAEDYLRNANAATSGIPGVQSIGWPIDRFEQAFGLHALINGGLYDHPDVRSAAQPHVAQLGDALTRQGLGFNDYFAADADMTGAAVAVLAASGDTGCAEVQLRFNKNGHFCTYKREFQASISAAARSIDALRMAGRDVRGWQRSLVRMQSRNGAWTGDKWNSSWIYTTFIALNALKGSVHSHSKVAALRRLAACQNRDGGFSSGGHSNTLETAFGLLALHALREDLPDRPELDVPIADAYRWLLDHYLARHEPLEEVWTSKQIYSPTRIDRVYIMSALVGGAMHVDRLTLHRTRQPQLAFVA